jgi:N-methylhydantoinase B
VIREIEFLAPVSCALTAERRSSRPWGLAGGSEGRAGSDFIRTGAGASWKRVPCRFALELPAGAALRIETPGGGGWGRRRG